MFRLAMAMLAVCAALVSSSARAYSIANRAYPGCHEDLAMAVLRREGWPDDALVAPLEGRLRSVADEVPLRVDGMRADAWSFALVIGVRFNDSHGYAPDDFLELSDVQNADVRQREHCLRARDQDGAAGDAAALIACRAFIDDALAQALGDAQTLDADRTERVPVDLSHSGRFEADMPAYPFHLGRAIHALEDSFAHTFRSADQRRVRHVLNYVDWQRDARNADAERDGHAHMSALDHCERRTSLSRLRADVALEAVAALMRAMNDSTGGPTERLARARAALDPYFVLEPGCTAANAWCDAPELRETYAGCALGARSSLAPWPFVLALLSCLSRSRRTRDRGFASFVLLVLLALLAASSAMTIAHAEDERCDAPVALDEPRWSLLASVSASFERGALSERIGARYRVSSLVELGLNVEHNAWFSIPTSDLSAGVLNAWLTVSFRWAQLGALELHSSLGAGASVLLTELAAAPAGAVGPYVEAGLLGVGHALDRRWQIFVDPFLFAVPMPHVVGDRLIHPQYRLLFGVKAAL